MIFVFGKRQILLAGLVCCFFMAFAAVLWTGHGLGRAGIFRWRKHALDMGH